MTRNQGWSRQKSAAFDLMRPVVIYILATERPVSATSGTSTARRKNGSDTTTPPKASTIQFEAWNRKSCSWQSARQCWLGARKNLSRFLDTRWGSPIKPRRRKTDDDESHP